MRGLAVAPEDARRGAARGCLPADVGDPEQREARERREQAEDPPGLPREQGLDDERRHDDRHEHDRLHPGQHGKRERAREERLPPCRRPLQHRRRGELGERHERVVGDLGHHEARVAECRQRERERRRGERPDARPEPPRPQVGGHGGERHQQRLDDPEDPVAALEVAERERKPRDRRPDEADEARRPAEDRELALAPEPLAEQRVDHLVAREPRRRHEPCRPRSEDGREQHEPEHDGQVESPSPPELPPRAAHAHHRHGRRSGTFRHRVQLELHRLRRAQPRPGRDRRQARARGRRARRQRQPPPRAGDPRPGRVHGRRHRARPRVDVLSPVEDLLERFGEDARRRRLNRAARARAPLAGRRLGPGAHVRAGRFSARHDAFVRLSPHGWPAASGASRSTTSAASSTTAGSWRSRRVTRPAACSSRPADPPTFAGPTYASSTVQRGLAAGRSRSTTRRSGRSRFASHRRAAAAST